MISQLLDFVLHINDHLAVMVQQYGTAVYGILFLIIFIETGLVVMPFLPGDSLLFAAGALCANESTGLNFGYLFVILTIAAVAGDNCNYAIGRFLGLRATEIKFRNKKIVKQEYLNKTHEFFERYGTKAIIMARFVPIVRTFTPFVAGLGKMSYNKKFLPFDIAGGVLWIGSMLTCGYVFGQIEWIKTHFEIVVILIVLISVLPMLFAFLKTTQQKILMPVYGLIGFPLTHSFSKAYFTAKFEREGLKNFSYINCEISSISDLKLIIAKEKLAGFNVTIPYKEEILPYLDSVSAIAEKIASVNTVICGPENKLKGFNTDYAGFKETLMPLLKPYHNHALILGNGGAAKTVAFVLDELNIEYKIVTRKPSSGNSINYNELRAIDVRNAPLLINTTPSGMFPDIKLFPEIPYEGIDKFHLLFDLIYNPSETMFLKRGKDEGAQTVNGYGMLVRQAEEAWKIWSETKTDLYL